jgi:hypothetical protein
MAPTPYPVTTQVTPATGERNRLTTAFRFLLGIPHILLVGGPAAAGLWLGWNWHGDSAWGSSGGVIGVAAGLVSLIAWLAIVITGAHPDGLWRFAAYYVRWRVRVLAYLMLLRDEYPPFGDDAYPAELVIAEPPAGRNRLTVFFRLLLALPHLILVGMLTVLWAFTTAVAWLAILLTGRYPETLYGFALGALAWTARVESYALLLTDEYPPFTLRT